MVYSIKDEKGSEITDNKLRNELIFASKQDMSYTYYNSIKYHIETVHTDRQGFKQLNVKED